MSDASAVHGPAALSLHAETEAQWPSAEHPDGVHAMSHES